MEKLLISEALRLIRERPDDFEVDKYEIRHRPTGLRVWIANGPTALRVSYREWEAGGVTFFSAWFGRLIPWRRDLYREAYSLYEGLVEVQISEFLAATHG